MSVVLTPIKNAETVIILWFVLESGSNSFLSLGIILYLDLDVAVGWTRCRFRISFDNTRDSFFTFIVFSVVVLEFLEKFSFYSMCISVFEISVLVRVQQETNIHIQCFIQYIRCIICTEEM